MIMAGEDIEGGKRGQHSTAHLASFCGGELSVPTPSHHISQRSGALRPDVDIVPYLQHRRSRYPP
jgi:hypothetical protein